jgi:hypothetical protein
MTTRNMSAYDVTSLKFLIENLKTHPIYLIEYIVNFERCYE